MFDDKFRPPYDPSAIDSTPIDKLDQYLNPTQLEPVIPTRYNENDELEPKYTNFSFRKLMTYKDKMSEDVKIIVIVLILFLLFNYRKVLEIIGPMLPSFNNGGIVPLIMQGTTLSAGLVVLKHLFFR